MSEHNINSLEDLVNLFAYFKEEKFPFRLTFKKAGNRSLSQNGLYWQWMTAQAKKFTTDKEPQTKERMHDLMRHKFLGYHDVIIGRVVISNQLKSTTDCDSGEMFHYMEKINAWSADVGLLLPIPEESEYKEILERVNQ